MNHVSISNRLEVRAVRSFKNLGLRKIPDKKFRKKLTSFFRVGLFTKKFPFGT